MATKANASNLELHNGLAESCLWSKHYDCALSEFKNILEVNPVSVQAHMLLALALDGMNKTPDAIVSLRRLIASLRTNQIFISNLGTVLQDA